MEQIDGSVYYNSNSKEAEDDEDDDSTFQDTIQVEDASYDTVHLPLSQQLCRPKSW